MVTSVIKKLALSSEELIAEQSVKPLSFKDTNELDSFAGILGQERATTALKFGVAMQHSGYNIYVMGESGTGRTSYIRHHLEGEASRMESPHDWVYVNNFDDPRSPCVINLSAGQGSQLKEDFNTLISNLHDTFPAAFENPAYQQNKSEIERQFNKSYDFAIDRIEQEALKHNIALFRDAGSLTFAPMNEGKAMEETEFARLPDKEREKFNDNISMLETMLNDELAEMPQWKRTSSEQLRKLNHDTIDQALEPLLSPLKKKYSQHDDVLNYLTAIKDDLHLTVVEHLAEERGIESREDVSKRTYLKERYVPNVIVDNDKKAPGPVVFETHPTYRNLFGRVEYTTEMGALVTNYTQICAGSLHKANGGFLVIEAAKLLEEPFVWEALKRALKEKQLKIEPPSAELNFINTISLAPEIIPLDVKVILIGSRQIYYLMQELDHDFHEMFRVLVDFDGHIERTPESIHAFSRLLKSRAEEKQIPALTAQAVAKLVEYSSRLAEHKEQLTAHIGDIFDLLAEADYIRRLGKGRKVSHKHISDALKAKAERANRVSKEMLKEILEGSILIDTKGEKIGKINGLTVLSIGDTSFGSPIRITSTVYPGSQGIIDIEREVQLGQAIHSKGVMILTGYLGNKYAQEFSMGISANIAMEQSYGYIDGDSASLAELCCLISALTDIPINQSFAVTGSINQHGEVQAIGGVNEKIEGFFDLCSARGLTGKQGAIIPKSNVRNLMLDNRVVDAVKKGKFTIYAVETVDEAMVMLLNKKAGSRNTKGNYPKDSINHQILERLKEIAEMNKEAGSDD